MNTEFINKTVRYIAYKNRWKIIGNKESKQIIMFTKDGVFLDFYLRTRRMISCMKHPIAGVSILERENLAIREIEAVFKNVRFHTYKGRRIKNV